MPCYKLPKINLSREQLFEWRLAKVGKNSYGDIIEKWVSSKSGWSALVILNNNPKYSIYDEKNNFVGVLEELP